MSDTWRPLAKCRDPQYDGFDVDSELHPFRPRMINGTEPTLVCRRCGEWYDHPNHGEDDDD